MIIRKPNYNLKAALIARHGTITRASMAISNEELAIDQFRLGRIIHGRVEAKHEEKRAIAWSLQKPINELFPE